VLPHNTDRIIGGGAYTHFLRLSGKHCCLPYHFSASKLIFLPFPFHIVIFVSFWGSYSHRWLGRWIPLKHGSRTPFLTYHFKCMLNHYLEWYKWVSTNSVSGTTDSGLTHLLHDHSPDGGTYPTISFCKQWPVQVTLSNRTTPKIKVTLECGTNPTNGNSGTSWSVRYRHPEQGQMPVISSTLCGGT